MNYELIYLKFNYNIFRMPNPLTQLLRYYLLKKCVNKYIKPGRRYWVAKWLTKLVKNQVDAFNMWNIIMDIFIKYLRVNITKLYCSIEVL